MEARLLRCALCHDDLRRWSEPPCPGCGTLLHRECLAELRACPTLGCRRSIATPGRRPPLATSSWRTTCTTVAAAALVVVGIAAAVLYAWMSNVRRVAQRHHTRAALHQSLRVDLATVVSEARALHVRLAPGAERPVAASELTGFPGIHDVARGGAVAWEDGVVVYLDGPPDSSCALVVLARQDATSMEDARQRLSTVELPDLVELEPGVFVRSVTR